MTDQEFKEKIAEKKRERVRAVPCEVYSRVVGYYRPVSQWNEGKKQEFSERVEVDLSSLSAPLPMGGRLSKKQGATEAAASCCPEANPEKETPSQPPPGRGRSSEGAPTRGGGEDGSPL